MRKLNHRKRRGVVSWIRHAIVAAFVCGCTFILVGAGCSARSKPNAASNSLTKIVFVSKDWDDLYAPGRGIYVMNADGSNQVNISKHKAMDANPAWSPDGTKIAFATMRSGNFDIYVMRADGTHAVRLTTNRARDISPACSPDGSKIAFASFRDGNFEIFVMNADGRYPVRLTKNELDDMAPAFSPDGMQIAFVTDDRDSCGDIYVIGADGTNLFNLTNSSRADDEAPRYNWQR